MNAHVFEVSVVGRSEHGLGPRFDFGLPVHKKEGKLRTLEEGGRNGEWGSTKSVAFLVVREGTGPAGNVGVRKRRKMKEEDCWEAGEREREGWVWKPRRRVQKGGRRSDTQKKVNGKKEKGKKDNRK